MRMSSSQVLLTLVRMAAMTLMMQVGLAATSAAQRQESIKESINESVKEGIAGQSKTEPTRTGKERLGGKASDPQRVDNCKVPLDQRGSTPRSDDCSDGTSAPTQRR
jgi:hypothetical protein